MDENDEQDNSNSRLGWGIGAIVLVPILYLFGFPFVIKLMFVCGASEYTVMKVLTTIYAPLLYLERIDFPGKDLLMDYYQWCAKWLGI